MTATVTLPREEIASRLEPALATIALGAAARDAAPRFPAEAFASLAAGGALGLTVPRSDGARPVSFADEWGAVRAVARADGAVGRIYDGHLNAVERLVAGLTGPLRRDELAAVAAGARWLGLWGADPLPDAGEGTPARLSGSPGDERLDGVKVFCSGAGGVHRALVLARGADGAGAPRLCYVDLAEGVTVDRAWYRASGMRASESHRVVFDGARVLAILGIPGELAREPWFSRDAIRTAASWAGVADTAVDSALDILAAKGRGGELEGLAAGRILTARRTIDLWLEGVARVAQAGPDASLAVTSVELREAVAGAARLILDEAARACGSRPFALAGPLDRARRDLDVFLLQHRLDPLVSRRGAAALEARR